MKTGDRKALYALIPPVMALLTLYGVLTQEQAAAWSAVGLATIGCIVAFWHVPETDPPPKRAMEED